MTSVVYFAESSGRIKIGFSRDVRSRMQSLGAGNPGAISVIATMPGGRSLESRIHAELAAYRHQREWFFDCPEVREAIPKYTAIAANETQSSRNLEAIVKQHQIAPVATCNFLNVGKRFTALIDLDVVDRMVAARKTEERLGLARGEVVDKIMSAEQRKALRDATDLLLYAHAKFGKILDKCHMALLDDDINLSPYFTACEQLICAVEAAFAPLLTGQSILTIRKEREPHDA